MPKANLKALLNDAIFVKPDMYINDNLSMPAKVPLFCHMLNNLLQENVINFRLFSTKMFDL